MLYSKEYKSEKCKIDFSMLRKMSIIIYFTHFAFATGFRFLYEREIISFQFGFIEFGTAIVFCIILSYFIVKKSEVYPMLKYLY